MKYFFLSLAFFAFVHSSAAQSSSQKDATLNITATGEVEVPADLVHFRITVNAEADSPQEVYRLHRQREQALVDLIKQNEVDEDDISYEPITINKQLSGRGNDSAPDTSYVTTQNVTLTLSDFDLYERMQVALIENDYDNFGGEFSASDMADASDRALEKAVKKARRKAELMSRAAGTRLGSIKHLSYSENVSGPQPIRMKSAMRFQQDSGMVQFNQSLTVQATVSAEFLLQEN